MAIDTTALKEQFVKLVHDNIKREGINNLMNWLDVTDFYIAPASTKYHGSYPGGLVEHSIHVYYAIQDELDFLYGKDQDVYSPETAAIVSLFHDICKIGRYKTEYRNVKDNETGQWYQKQVYTINNDNIHTGHGADSVIKIMNFMHLNEAESNAIFWHMGAFDTSPYMTTTDMCNSYKKNPLAYILHRADTFATYVIENENFVFPD